MLFIKFLILFLIKSFYDDSRHYEFSLYLYTLYNTSIENIFITRTILLTEKTRAKYIVLMVSCLMYKYILHEYTSIVNNLMFILNVSDLFLVFGNGEKAKTLICICSLILSLPMLLYSYNIPSTLTFIFVSHSLRLV